MTVRDVCKLGPFLSTTFLALILAGAAQAQDASWDAGIRVNGIGGSGRPSNDVLGFGLFGHRHFNQRWALGFGIDHSSEFDVERAAMLVGIDQDPSVGDIDNLGEMTILKLWVRRTYRSQRRLRIFWLLGSGLADVTVDPISGPRADGGTFTVAVEAGSETVLEAGLGIESQLGSRWFLQVVGRFEHHLADWKLTDLESSSTGLIDDYSLRGIHVAVGLRF